MAPISFGELRVDLSKQQQSKARAEPNQVVEQKGLARAPQSTEREPTEQRAGDMRRGRREAESKKQMKKKKKKKRPGSWDKRDKRDKKDKKDKKTDETWRAKPSSADTGWSKSKFWWLAKSRFRGVVGCDDAVKRSNAGCWWVLGVDDVPKTGEGGDEDLDKMTSAQDGEAEEKGDAGVIIKSPAE
ncbi:hypothetical protein NLG97_g7680 [Lecanicillium saksenae]|uniref:Uncharacterized protein n=1 Tax=Lecanicillium saksenae TaxID=468837 RepID=A0ACC1QMZ3_9HYPO|nr:hypothetical protein NLG97_g7680 [Lecanicillium saksenae]